MRKLYIMLIIFCLFIFSAGPVFAREVEGTTADTNTTNQERADATGNVSCSEFKDISGPIWLTIQIAAPVLTIIMGATDFLKATAASDEKEIKKAISTFVKRLVLMIAILILPLIVNILVGFTQYSDLSACL